MSRVLAALLASAACGLAAGPAAAAVTPAAPVADASGAGHALSVARDGDVTIAFTGRSGSYSKQLYLVRPGQDDVLVFDGRTANAGDTVNLGAFRAGEALTFRLAVEAGQVAFDLYTGSGDLNPAGFANARAMGMGGRTALVSFEDMWAGGDLSFNDFGFSLENVFAGDVIPNPLPGAAVFMLTALGGAAAWRRRR